MARRKKTKIIKRSRKNSRNNVVKSYFGRGEFWIGVLTVIVMAILVSKLPFTRILSNVQSYRIMVVKITPTPVLKKAIVKPQITPKVTSQPQITTKTYTVENGDSYFTATQKVCGDGTFYIFNQDLNQGKALQIGDSIQIRCNW